MSSKKDECRIPKELVDEKINNLKEELMALIKKV